MKFIKKYIIRREYFGAYVFDRELQLDYIFDEESAEVFSTAYKDLSLINQEDYENLKENHFITETGLINYDYFENEIFGEVFSAPIVAHFPYTYKCNLNCKHCFSKGEKKVEMSYEKKVEILNDLQCLGVCKIMIGGGEPFLGEGFMLFLKECVDRGFVTKVFTNGLCLNEDVIASLANLNLGGISISVDSPDESAYYGIRGVNGLPKVINNVRKLTEVCSFPIAISATIGTYNLSKEKELLDLAKICNVTKLKIRPIRPTGNACVNSEILPTAQEYLDYIQRIQTIYNEKKYKKYFKLDLNWGSGKIIATKSKIDLSKVSNPYSEFGCIAGKDIIIINPDGSIFPCGFLPDITGCKDNVMNSSIIDIWKNSPNFLFLRNLKTNETCYRCRYYGCCRGGCPARNLYDNKGYEDIDPWCPKKYFPIKLG